MEPTMLPVGLGFRIGYLHLQKNGYNPKTKVKNFVALR
jgi:hypothetical protein